MTRGLVIGKFYPPHRGHKFLIETARSQVDSLVVLICDPGNEQPPARYPTRRLAARNPS